MNTTLSRTRKFFCAIAILATIAAFATGIFAIVTQRDTPLQIISFSLAFVSLLVALIEAIPGVVGYIWESLRTAFYIFIVLIVIIALCSLGFVVLQEPTIKIGVSLPFASSDKEDAMHMFNAINLAMHDGTENGKIGKYRIQLVPFDDSEMAHLKIQPMWEETRNPKGNIEDFTTITGDPQIAGIIGPFNSGIAAYEIPLANNTSIALISPASTADCLTTFTNIKGDNFPECQFSGLDKNKEKSFFRMATPDSFRAEVLAGYFWQEKIGKRDANTAKEAVIFNDKLFFGRSFANRLQEAWKNKMNKEAPILDLTDNPLEDLKNLKLKPDVILFAGTGPKAIALYDAMKATGYSETKFAAAATIMRGGVPNSAAKGDIYAISPYGYFDQSEQYSKFSSVYKNTYQKDPTRYSASAYDATRILLKSIQEALKYKTPPVATFDLFSQTDQFRMEVVRNIKLVNNSRLEFTGATGTYHFDPNGNAINYTAEKEATIYKHIQGTANEWEYVPYTPKK